MTDMAAPAGASSKEIIFVADPMCSWCWGFSPVIRQVQSQYGADIPVKLVVGGLRPNETRVMDDGMKSYIRNHWHHVAEASGQPFNEGVFERDDFVYDTEPSCRAMVTMRHLRPDLVMDYLEKVHHAFYVENRDTTDPNVLAALAAEFDDLDAESFLTVFGSEDMLRDTWKDFTHSRALGVSGYPAVLLREGEQHGMLTMGYAPFERLNPVLARWVAGEQIFAHEAGNA